MLMKFSIKFPLYILVLKSFDKKHNQCRNHRTQGITITPHQWLNGCVLKVVDVRCQVQFPNALVDLAVFLEFFLCFLKNSPKYELGSLRKIPMEGIPPIGPDPISGQLTLNVHPSIL